MENLNEYELGEAWKAFPPTEADAARLREGEEREKLYEGRFENVLRRWTDIKKKRPESPRLKLNFFRVVSDEFAKMIVGEKPTVTVTANAQAVMDELFEATELRTKLYQALVMASVQGGVALKAWRDAGGGVHIDLARDGVYFPSFDPDDATRVTGVTLAWERLDKDTGKMFLVREAYRPGDWKKDVLDMSEWQIDPIQMAKWYPEAPTEWTPTGYDGIPVEYIPNYQLAGRFWGESDYPAIQDIVEEIMTRFSTLADVLDKHSYPSKVVPRQVIDEVRETSRDSLAREGAFPRQEADVVTGRDKNALSSTIDLFGAEPGEDPGNLPRYVTWDASLASAYQELEKAFELLLITTCLPPEVFGLSKYGVSESGRALRFRNTRALAEANKKRLFMLPPLKRIIRAALALSGYSVELRDISIVTEDGLPFDQLEATQIAVQQKAAGIASLRTAIRLINPDLTSAAVEDEVRAIEAELSFLLDGETPGIPRGAVNPDGGNSP
ncbi:MAG: phage portal protein [Synergistaceae bacterium]|nr:phage portal protein [Synergistaceae bacterium]